MSTLLEVDESGPPDLFAVNTRKCVRSDRQSFESANCMVEEAVSKASLVDSKDSLPLKRGHALAGKVSGREFLGSIGDQPAHKRARYHAV